MPHILDAYHRSSDLAANSITKLFIVFCLSLLALPGCASVDPMTIYTSLMGPEPQAELPAYNGPRHKLVILEFANSANVEQFEVVADANLLETNKEQGSTNLEKGPTKSETESKHTESVTEEQANSDHFNTNQSKIAILAREVTETALFQSGRFEVIPYFAFEAEERKLRASGMSPMAARLQAARNLNVRYFAYGDLTDFEIRTETSYWKVPFWAIVLLGSFFIEDDDLRVFIWQAMLRAAIAVPADHAMWQAGVGKQDLDLVVSIAMDLRLTDARNATVVFSGSRTVERHEKSSALELVVWRGDNKVKIGQSNAGRQIRFVAGDLTRQAVRAILPETAHKSSGIHTKQPAVKPGHATTP